MDDHPLRIFGRLEVLGQGDLARSPPMDSAPFEGEGLSCTDGHDVLGSGGIVYTGSLFAGEVATSFIQRAVVECGKAVRHWALHDHMSIGASNECESSSCEEAVRRHVGCGVSCRTKLDC